MEQRSKPEDAEDLNVLVSKVELLYPEKVPLSQRAEVERLLRPILQSAESPVGSVTGPSD